MQDKIKIDDSPEVKKFLFDLGMGFYKTFDAFTKVKYVLIILNDDDYNSVELLKRRFDTLRHILLRDKYICGNLYTSGVPNKYAGIADSMYFNYSFKELLEDYKYRNIGVLIDTKDKTFNIYNSVLWPSEFIDNCNYLGLSVYKYNTDFDNLIYSDYDFMIESLERRFKQDLTTTFKINQYFNELVIINIQEHDLSELNKKRRIIRNILNNIGYLEDFENTQFKDTGNKFNAFIIDNKEYSFHTCTIDGDYKYYSYTIPSNYPEYLNEYPY